MAMAVHRPIVLLILDGWGYSENPRGNAIFHARKPVWDSLWEKYPHTLISGSGTEVGLPADQMGNSEVGHLNLGAGRVVYQEFTRISRGINNGSFFTNRTLVDAAQLAAKTKKAIHILGLLSPGGVHSHETQIHALVQMAAQHGVENIFVHAFLDGRDTAPRSAGDSIEAMEAVFKETGKGAFGSVIGRYFAMDRDHRWPRVQAAYELIAEGNGLYQTESAESGLRAAYERGETDEFVQATAIIQANGKPARVEDGDIIIFANYRSDRARQITRAFIEDDFDGFSRKRHLKLGRFVSLTEYNKEFDIPVAYPPERLTNTFGTYIANKGLHQLRIAETEKYAHVTFFFNGGEETPAPGEERILVPSPNVATYDLKPSMSAAEVTDKLVSAIESGKFDVIICNYANGDMVGHTGSLPATITAIETLDECLGRVVSATQNVGGELLITADHGNAEQMLAPDSDEPHTAHTFNLVPFIYVGRSATVKSKGSLADVAPTMLRLMDLEQPPEMSGRSLVHLTEVESKR